MGQEATAPGSCNNEGEHRGSPHALARGAGASLRNCLRGTWLEQPRCSLVTGFFSSEMFRCPTWQGRYMDPRTAKTCSYGEFEKGEERNNAVTAVKSDDPYAKYGPRRLAMAPLGFGPHSDCDRASGPDPARSAHRAWQEDHLGSDHPFHQYPRPHLLLCPGS